MINKDFEVFPSFVINEYTIEEFLDKRSSFSKNHETYRFVIITALDDYIFIYDTLRDVTLSINSYFYSCEIINKWFKEYDVKFTLTPSYSDQEFENSVLDALGLTYEKLVTNL